MHHLMMPCHSVSYLFKLAKQITKKTHKKFTKRKKTFKQKNFQQTSMNSKNNQWFIFEEHKMEEHQVTGKVEEK